MVYIQFNSASHFMAFDGLKTQSLIPFSIAYSVPSALRFTSWTILRSNIAVLPPFNVVLKFSTIRACKFFNYTETVIENLKEFQRQNEVRSVFVFTESGFPYVPDQVSHDKSQRYFSWKVLSWFVGPTCFGFRSRRHLKWSHGKWKLKSLDISHESYSMHICFPFHANNHP